VESHAPEQVAAHQGKAATAAPASTVRKQLTKLIQNCARRVPFYGRHWAALATRLSSMQFPEQLGELPLVTKADLLAQPPDDLLDSSFSDNSLSVEKTSGSSGQPMEIHKDQASVRRRGLRFLRGLLACGYRPGQRLMLISTRRSGGLMSYARWHYVDLRDEQLLQEHQKIRPDVLYGPLSSLLQICDQARRDTASLHKPSIVVSTAEQMIPAQRALLEATFGCPVADFYGMTEFGLVAFRRPQATDFELASDDLLLEYVPLADDSAAERLIVTDLSGGAMPLVRYDTGDLVSRNREQKGQPIREFVGRRIDSVRMPSGDTVSPYRVTLGLETLKLLRQYRVVQRKDLSVDVYFHCDERQVEAVRSDIANVLAGLCPGLPLRFHFEKAALLKVAGKFRPVESEVRAGA